MTVQESPELVSDTTPTAGREHVVVSSVVKDYGGTRAVDNVTLGVGRGELLTLLGPSGSGKTTLLRTIAGLAQPTSGEIWVDGDRVDQQPPYKRDVGVVFQSLALFPHIDVFGNVAFPLWMRRRGKRETAQRVKDALEMVRLPDVSRRKINELSGGQRQRVALARALVYRPALLLLDEPLGALDRNLREEMQLELLRLHNELEVAIVNVTHDQQEALTISDRVAVMDRGRIRQLDTVVDIYRTPSCAFVAGFLGHTTLVPGIFRVASPGDGPSLEVGREGTSLPAVSTDSAELREGQEAFMALRAESITLLGDRETGEGPTLAGKIALKAFQGNATQFEVDVPTLALRVRVESVVPEDASRFSVGDHVRVSWRPDSAPVVGG